MRSKLTSYGNLIVSDNWPKQDIFMVDGPLIWNTKACFRVNVLENIDETFLFLCSDAEVSAWLRS